MSEVILCPFCSKAWTRDMLDTYSTTCGSDTCAKIGVEIICKNCGRVVYVKADFGWHSDKEDIERILSSVTDDELKQIANKERKRL